jgi:hypothetical protein
MLRRQHIPASSFVSSVNYDDIGYPVVCSERFSKCRVEYLWSDFLKQYYYLGSHHSCPAPGGPWSMESQIVDRKDHIDRGNNRCGAPSPVLWPAAHLHNNMDKFGPKLFYQDIEKINEFRVVVCMHLYFTCFSRCFRCTRHTKRGGGNLSGRRLGV